MGRVKFFCLFIAIAVLSACDKDDDDADSSGGLSTTPNILLIIADDMGKDATSGFSEGNIKPNTPNLDKIRNEGLVFNNFWVNPTCSPTRAAIITGKYGYRTGVKWANDELSSTETTLQQYIDEQTNDAYATAIIGKWHLSGENASTTFSPDAFGLDYYAGLLRGAVQDYYQWQLTEDDQTNRQTTYTSKVFTDLSIDWINAQSKPWFLWLAYNAPHTPFHTPPSEMHAQGNLPDYANGLDPTPYYMAAIEAMDFQIGRLLESIPDEVLDNTLLLFLGDNGSPNQVAQLPFANGTAKGSLYQGGINVPLFVSGKGVSRSGVDNSLICNTDLFSTIAGVAGVGATEIHDSKSFEALLSNAAPHRNFQYSEMNDDTDDLWAISDGTFKLLVNANGNEELYNLNTDPYESNNLLNGMLSSEEENAKAALEAELSIIRN
ncbi:MAG: sulfatase-like hydrolase/transferase [Bacteroidota bacterium]